jgi:predicted ATP-grasp superfamily ATP-dependent carboligase
MPLTVFVTDGDQRPTLAIVRTLGRRGLRVLVGEEGSASLASASKYCAGHVTYPSPYRDRRAFEQFLDDFVVRERIDLVMPVTDVTTRAVCANQERLGRHCALAVPPLGAFDLVTNKARLLEYAASCGVSIPRTHVVDGAARWPDALDTIAYPVVVKPVQSRMPTEHGWESSGVHYANCRAELEQLYQDHDVFSRYPSLIQERIVGPGVGVFVLFDRGTLVADFAHRRLREKPPAGGASVLSESAPVEARLRDQAIRLLGQIGWHGVAMMEYKQDERSGDFVLMEVNGRFWGSLQLAIDAGVDFPFLACQLATGRRPEVPQPYAVGVKNRWLCGDVDHLLMRLFRSARSLHLPAGTSSKWRALADFLKFAEPGLHYDVAARDDMRPSLYELRQYAGALFMPQQPASCGEARRPASAKATAVRRSFSQGGSAEGAKAAELAERGPERLALLK